jgi:uncharacterized protein
LNILVSGSTGLIGSAVCSFLGKKRHRILRLVRREPSGSDEILWNPSSGIPDTSALEGLDAVIHLAGENIAVGRWTTERKCRIRESRIQGTQLLAKSLAYLFDPPKVLVSISAIGYYGNRGDELLDEQSSAGTGFLSELCQEWEAATVPAAMRGIRVVTPRVGMVLSAAGGALAMMLPVYRRGMGGRIGNGRQYMSWITMDDLVRVIHHAITHESFQGPINAVSPYPVTNREFSKTLGRVLERPARLILPAFVARLALGQMADEVLIAGAKATPFRLIKSGYRFAYPELEGALHHILQIPNTQE